MNAVNRNIHAVVVMGVAGCGKSTVAALLAGQLGWEFRDADDFHPAANVAKMSSGTPLTDEDRWPWLEAIADWIETRHAAGLNSVVTCSALKRVYRERLLGQRGGVRLVYLDGSFELISARMAARMGHFMPTSLLKSQFATLEPPMPDENPLVVSIDRPPHEIVAEVLQHIR